MRSGTVENDESYKTGTRGNGFLAALGMTTVAGSVIARRPTWQSVLPSPFWQFSIYRFPLRSIKRKGKVCMKKAYAVGPILLLCAFLLTGCRISGLDLYFPGNMHEVYSYHSDMPGDSCEARVFILDEGDAKEAESRFEKDAGWRRLPMQEEEYRIFVENCLEWAASYVPDFDFDRLKDQDCTGYWRYTGDYSKNRKDWPYYTWGRQELIIYLTESRQVIYLYNFE